MNHKLHKEYEQGKLIRLTLGIPQVDSFLEMIRASFSYNTWINYAHDLKIFVNVVDAPERVAEGGRRGTFTEPFACI